MPHSSLLHNNSPVRTCSSILLPLQEFFLIKIKQVIIYHPPFHSNTSCCPFYIARRCYYHWFLPTLWEFPFAGAKGTGPFRREAVGNPFCQERVCPERRCCWLRCFMCLLFFLDFMVCLVGSLHHIPISLAASPADGKQMN